MSIDCFLDKRLHGHQRLFLSLSQASNFSEIKVQIKILLLPLFFRLLFYNKYERCDNEISHINILCIHAIKYGANKIITALIGL